MVCELNHPLVSNNLAIIRDKNTVTKDFRNSIKMLSKLCFYEASKNISTYEKEIETPITKTKVNVIKEENIVVVPILRAGLAMSEAILEEIPSAKAGHIGVYRDKETKMPVEYLVKLPKGIEDKEIFLVDPMLATGGSLIHAIKILKEYGAKNIKALCIIAAPEGIENVTKEYDDIDIYVTSIDERLNENKYIVPGLGDAGDRIFGTED